MRRHPPEMISAVPVTPAAPVTPAVAASSVELGRAIASEARSLAARYARRLGPTGHQQAEDLAQEVVVRTLEHPPPDHRVGPWMERIAANLAVDGWRRQARTGRAHARVLAAGADGAAGVTTPHDILAGREARRLVRREVRALPLGLRRLVLARFGLNWSYDRTAARAGLGQPTARSQVRRAIVRLRAALGALRALVPPWLLPSALPQHAFLLAQPVAAVALVVAVGVPGVGATEMMAMAPAATSVTQAAPRRAARRARPVPATPVPTKAAAPAPAATARPAPARSPARTVHPAASKRADDRVRATENDDVTIEPVQRFIYRDDEVEGGRDAPDDVVVSSVADPEHPSLIEIRPHFRAEIVKSLEDMD